MKISHTSKHEEGQSTLVHCGYRRLKEPQTKTTACMYMKKQRTFLLQGKNVLTWKHHSLNEELVVLEILLNYLRKMRRKRSVKECTGAIEIDLGEYQSEEGVLSPKITVNI